MEENGGITIREGERADLRSLVVVWNEFMDYHLELDPGYARREDAADMWLEYIEPSFDDPDWKMYVALDGAAFVGFVIVNLAHHPPVYLRTRHGFVHAIAVLESHRRRGVAGLLLESAERWLRARGVPEITVRIDERNAASKALFYDAEFEPWVVLWRKPID